MKLVARVFQSHIHLAYTYYQTLKEILPVHVQVRPRSCRKHYTTNHYIIKHCDEGEGAIPDNLLRFHIIPVPVCVLNIKHKLYLRTPALLLFSHGLKWLNPFKL